MIEKALAISRIEQSSMASAVSEFVEPMPVFYPSTEEFRNPIDYIEKLMEVDGANIAQYGCIKIVPPSHFKPPLAFDINSE